ncbi:leucine-rich repeat domain-containing protein [Aeoliella sp. SH292]|uniref:leucine-rich repeat domain-containing protein n=1 Tax=Aeoliella sp. SH292 TaxID=3454464 RepID=UPI003F94EBD6
MQAFPICPIASSFVSPPISNSNPSATFDATWIAITLLAILLLVVILVCCWLVWRMRTLVRVVEKLRSDKSSDVAVPSGLGFLPKFKLRTLLLAFTLCAVGVGLFMVEMRRARGQQRALSKLADGSNYYTALHTHYRLGFLGDSGPAQLLCSWAHPHFGCRLTHLELEAHHGRRVTLPMSTDTGLEVLAAFSDLQELWLKNQIFTIPELEAIARLENLRCLSLVDCQLPPDALKILMPLQKLERLQLYSCGIEDDDVAQLNVFPRLTDLSLGFNEVTDDGLAALTSLPNLQVLNLARTKVTNNGLESLSGLTELASLCLCYTAVDAEGIRSLTAMGNLQYVNVAQAGRVLSIDRPALEASAAENSKLKLEWNRVQLEFDAPTFVDNRPGVPTVPPLYRGRAPVIRSAPAQAP